MKKSLIALFAVAFCLTTMANVLVYDYKASFKRIDAKLTKYDAHHRMESPKVVSDKFTGYVIVEACKACDGDLEKSFDMEAKDNATILIVRNGDKEKNVIETKGAFLAGMFGAKAGLVENAKGVKEVLDKFTDAGLQLKFPISVAAGALGNGTAATEAIVDNAGFGKVTKQVTKTPGTPATKDKPGYWTPSDGCSDDWHEAEKGTEAVPGETKTCWEVKNISGSMMTSANYTGDCCDYLFDVCDFVTPATIDIAPIPGTFTLKLNNALTYNKKAFRFATADEAKAGIAAKQKTWKFAAADDTTTPDTPAVGD